MAEPSQESDFDGVLAQSLEQMDAVTKAADHDAEAMVNGEMGLHEAMVSMEKANLTLKLGTTVRNKLLDAYQELARTPL